MCLSHQDSLRIHPGAANYLFDKNKVGFDPHGGLELLDRRQLNELVGLGELLQRFDLCVTVNGSDVLEPAMTLLHTVVSSGDDEANISVESPVTQKHIEQIDASSDELEILGREDVTAAAAVAAANARLRFLRALRTSA